MAEHDDDEQAVTMRLGLHDLVQLLVVTYKMGAASGKLVAYGDCLKWTGRKFSEAEETMTRDPHNAFAMTECMVWAAFRDHYHGADAWNERELRAYSRELEAMGAATGLLTRDELQTMVEHLVGAN